MKKIHTLFKQIFRRMTNREKEFLVHLKSYCNEQHVEWLYNKIKSRIKDCCVNNHLDIIVEAKDGDWGDEVFDVKYSLERRYGKFIKAEQYFKHAFDWNSGTPYKGNPLIIHWEVNL